MENLALAVSDEILQVALEETEALYWSKYYDINPDLNCYANIISGAFAGAIPEVDILAMNRVIGLGMYSSVKAHQIDDIINFYKRAGVKRFFIQLSPHVIQDDLVDLLGDKGFVYHNNWVKLFRSIKPELPIVDTSFRIKSIGKAEANIYGEIIYNSFDWTDLRLKVWLQKTVGKQGYHHFLALDGELPVAAAALHTTGSFASMAFAGTLEDYRGKGAQSLLLKTRILTALNMGCKYFIAETAEPSITKPIASYQNMRRFGFEEAYLRQNWLYEI